MRKIIFGTALLTTSFVFISHATSFSSANVSQGAALSIVPAEQALISVHFQEEDKTFTITNNTEKIIHISSINLFANGFVTDLSYSPLSPGESRIYVIEGKADELFGAKMDIHFHWNGGQATITSTLPQFIEPEIAEYAEQLEPSEEINIIDEPDNKKEKPTQDTKEEPKQSETQQDSPSNDPNESTTENTEISTPQEEVPPNVNESLVSEQSAIHH